jgi:hypothetical protein
MQIPMSPMQPTPQFVPTMQTGAMLPVQQQWTAWGGPVAPSQPTFFNPAPQQFVPQQQFFQNPQFPQFPQQQTQGFPRYVAAPAQPAQPAYGQFPVPAATGAQQAYGQFPGPAAAGGPFCSKCYKQFLVDGVAPYSHQYGTQGFTCHVLCFYCKREGVTTKSCPNPACQQRAQAAALSRQQLQ